jgi:hypothetical protein
MTPAHHRKRLPASDVEKSTISFLLFGCLMVERTVACAVGVALGGEDGDTIVVSVEGSFVLTVQDG